MIKIFKWIAPLILLQFISVFAVLDTIIIQDGLNGYNGATDTYIGQGVPENTHNQGENDYLKVGRC